MDRSGVEAKSVIICSRERNLKVERVVATGGITGVKKCDGILSNDIELIML